MRKIYETGVGSFKMKAQWEYVKKEHCINIISTLINNDTTQNINMQGSIEQYFYTIDKQLLSDITKLIRKEVD